MSDFNAIEHDRSAAIHAALSTLLDPQQTAQALGLWREKYAAQPTFSVQYFVRDCCSLFGVSSLRNQLVQILVQELNSQRTKPVAEKKLAASSIDTVQHEAAVLTFQLLFRALTTDAGALRGREISRYVAESLAKISLASDARRSLELWLNDDMPLIEATVPVSVLVTLVNRTYIGLCEYCGPVKADQILHECVEKIAATTAGKQFHPQRLL